jgi:hypothetical protein
MGSTRRVVRLVAVAPGLDGKPPAFCLKAGVGRACGCVQGTALQNDIWTLSRAIAPFFSPTSTFSDHPKLGLDLSDPPRDAVKTSSFVRITQPHLNQRKHTMHMFQNFAPTRSLMTLC